MAERVLTCAVSADDGYEANGGGMTLTDLVLQMGMPNNNEVACAFRFPLPSTGWLVDKTLTDVSLRLTFTGVNQGSYTAKLYLENGATPGVLTTGSGDISGRTKTTAFVWFGSGVVGSPNPDEVKSYNLDGTGRSILLALEEVITSQTAALMDAIVVIVSYTASTTNGYRSIYAYDKPVTPATSVDPGPPRLVLTYSEDVIVDDRNVMFQMTDNADVVV